MSEEKPQAFSLETIRKYLDNARNIGFEIGDPPDPISNHDEALNTLDYNLFVSNARLRHHSQMIHDLFHIVEGLINYIQSKDQGSE